MPPEIGCRDGIEVGFSRQPASQSSDRVLHSTFLPRAVRIAEEGLNAEGFVEPMVLGKLIPVVEADGPAHCRGQFAKLAGNVPSGRDSFPIGRTVNLVEPGLPLVENHQPLTASGEHHEVSLPMAWRLAAVDLSRSFGNRAPLFDEAGGAAAPSPTPSHFLVTRQQTIPVILLSRTVIDETID